MKRKQTLRLLKKNIVGILFLIIISLIVISVTPTKVVHAEDNGVMNTNNNTPATATTNFNVKKYLSIPGQEQNYLVTPASPEGNANNCADYNGAGQATNCINIPIAAFIVQVINFITLIIGSLSLFAIIVGGFILMTSHGSENQTTKGKEIIKFAIIGLVITFCAYFIVSFVQSLLYEL